MPKNETLEIQNNVCELGKRLGFESHMEERLGSARELYSPIYDVVWYLNLEKHFCLDKLTPLFSDEPQWLERIKKIPFAGFEIEGSNASSKTQLSNFANLYSGYFLYRFVIVNNNGATGEHDTFRRGVKISRYFYGNGHENTFFMDSAHLKASLEKSNDLDRKISFSTQEIGQRKTFGGESKSIDIYKKISPYITGTGLLVSQNYSPEIFKIRYEMLKRTVSGDEFTDFYLYKSYYNEPMEMRKKKSNRFSDAFYIPKLDIVMGFDAPKGFVSWLHTLSNELEYLDSQFPVLYALKNKLVEKLFVPLISIEMETNINKHMNGGIYNMSRNSYLGILVTEKDAKSHLSYYKQELGIKNVINYYTESER